MGFFNTGQGSKEQLSTAAIIMMIKIFVLIVCVSLLELGQAQSGGFIAVNRQKKRRQVLEEVLAEIEEEESSREKRQTFSCRRGFHPPNYSYQGRNYLLSWRHGCTGFSQSEADSFCRNSNMRPISIDDSQEEREIRDLILREKQKYIWTGGKLSGFGRSISWPSGRSANRPQPDNRVGDEFCIAVLNNFYDDGVTFHDVGCSHKKPVICEAWVLKDIT